MIRSARPFLLAGAFLVASAAAGAQVTALEKQLSRIDLGISGVGSFTRDVSGPLVRPVSPSDPAVVSESASNTVGAMVNLRYVAKPFVGFEFNYVYARYKETFNTSPFGIQTTANEYTLGYIATPNHPIFGFEPFASAGLGSIQFKPTRGGGQGAPVQARAAYYYSAGLQHEYFSSHLGLRAGFRQVFFLAPDFLQNYLTIKKHTITSEPTIGFYLRF